MGNWFLIWFFEALRDLMKALYTWSA